MEPVTDYPHRSLIELAKSIEQMSGGRLKIETLPVGSVVGFFEVLDAVNRGALDGGLTWAGRWAGKNSAAGLFGSPLGGPVRDGAERSSPPGSSRAAARSSTTSCSRKSPPHDHPTLLEGVRSGIGLEMFKRMGISTVGMAGGDIVPSLERGVIDGAEWAIPSRDIVMGFQQAAKYCYMPSFKYATMAEITRLAAEAQMNPFFAKVLASQKEYARKTVPHAQTMTPPMDVVVRHYWQKR